MKCHYHRYAHCQTQVFTMDIEFDKLSAPDKYSKTKELLLLGHYFLAFTFATEL